MLNKFLSNAKLQFSSVFGVCLVMIAVSAVSSSQNKPKYALVMNLGHSDVSGSITDLTANKFKEFVEQNSRGQMSLEIYSAEGLKANSADGYAALDLKVCTPSDLAALDRRFDGFNLPFMIDSEESLKAFANDEEINTKVNNWLAPHQYQLLDIVAGEGLQLANSVKAIETPADLKGLKIGVASEGILASTLRSLGAEPVITEDLQGALAKGEIDGMFSTASDYLINGNYSKLPFFSVVNGVRQTQAWLFTSEASGSLNKAQRDMVIQSLEQALAWQNDLMDSFKANTLNTIKNKGVKVNDITAEQFAAFRDASRSVYAAAATDEGLGYKTVETFINGRIAEAVDYLNGAVAIDMVTGATEIDANAASAEPVPATPAAEEKAEVVKPLEPVVEEKVEAVAAETVAPVAEEKAEVVEAEPVAPVAEEKVEAVAAEPVAPVAEEKVEAVEAETVAPVAEEKVEAVEAEAAPAPVVEEKVEAVATEPVAPVAEEKVEAVEAEAVAPVAEEKIESVEAEAVAPIAEEKVEAVEAEAVAPVAEEKVEAVEAEAAPAPVVEEKVEAVEAAPVAEVTECAEVEPVPAPVVEEKVEAVEAEPVAPVAEEKIEAVEAAPAPVAEPVVKPLEPKVAPKTISTEVAAPAVIDAPVNTFIEIAPGKYQAVKVVPVKQVQYVQIVPIEGEIVDSLPEGVTPLQGVQGVQTLPASLK